MGQTDTPQNSQEQESTPFWARGAGKRLPDPGRLRRALEMERQVWTERRLVLQEGKQSHSTAGFKERPGIWREETGCKQTATCRCSCDIKWGKSSTQGRGTCLLVRLLIGGSSADDSQSGVTASRCRKALTPLPGDAARERPAWTWGPPPRPHHLGASIG